MELINAANAIGSKLIDTLCDPFCTVTRNNFNTCQLFGCELLIEFFENRFPMTERYPYHRIRIMIDDNSDVFVFLFVACLVYTDMDKIIKFMRYFRFCQGQAALRRWLVLPPVRNLRTALL